MAEIESVIEQLKQLEHCITKSCDETCTYYEDDMYHCHYDVSTEETVDEAIQTIRELQNQITKWHLVSDGDLPTDYMDVLLVVDRYSYVIEDWCRDTVQTYWNGDMKAFDYCKGWQAGHEPKIIAWMELPKFEGVE